MNNKVNPAVPIMLDKKRHLLLDLNAMVVFQEETGNNLFDSEVADRLSKSLSPRDLRALLWSCLIHEDESLTLKQVGSWLHSGNMEDIAGKLLIAWNTAMPEGGKNDAPLVPRRKHRHG